MQLCQAKDDSRFPDKDVIGRLAGFGVLDSKAAYGVVRGRNGSRAGVAGKTTDPLAR